MALLILMGRKKGQYHQVTDIHAIIKQNYSYRTKDWRYIRYSNGQEELYDHRNDPYEWHNLAKDPSRFVVKKTIN